MAAYSKCRVELVHRTTIAHETSVKSAKANGTHLFIVVRAIVVRVDKQYVLRLEIRVRELVVVQELDRVAQLVAHVPDVLQRIRLITVIPLQRTTVG